MTFPFELVSRERSAYRAPESGDTPCTKTPRPEPALAVAMPRHTNQRRALAPVRVLRQADKPAPALFAAQGTSHMALGRQTRCPWTVAE